MQRQARFSKILSSRAVLGEFQPGRMSEGRRINDGDPIGDYFPKIVDLATFTAVQNRRPGTPGQIGKAVTNLFTGICFDGASGARMKYVDKGTKKRGNGNWRYLVSDARRKDPAAPLCSWRYSDFENSFLKFVEDLDWAAIAGAGSSKPSRLENAVAKSSERVARSEKVMNKIVTAIKTTSQPPAVLVEELQSLEKEHAAASAEYAELKRRMDQENARSIELQRNSDAFKNALRATDLETRLRLRAELRKRIRRIDLYPVGLKRTWENGSRLDAEGSRVFQITFANDVERWVLCDTPDSGDAAVISMNPTVQGARRSQKAAKRARIEDSRPMAKTRSR